MEAPSSKLQAPKIFGAAEVRNGAARAGRPVARLGEDPWRQINLIPRARIESSSQRDGSSLFEG